MTDAPQQGIRLSKLMSERGLCSRREADSYIEQGWVIVDGQRSANWAPESIRAADRNSPGRRKQAAGMRVTILLHKPVGYVSGQPEPGYKPSGHADQAGSLLAGQRRPRLQRQHLLGLAPAGRLDIDSTGLLVLTQDGRIAKQLIGDDSDIEKEYLVRVRYQRGGRLPGTELKRLQHGLTLDGRVLRPAKVSWQNEDQLRFILREGMKRQIRRMCEAVGLEVLGLKRIRIGQVRLGDLGPVAFPAPG
jgi:23S rRNA pseudouridine2604 synthase